MAKRKIGKVNRTPGKFVYVDAQGNVWEMDRPRRGKKAKRRKK